MTRPFFLPRIDAASATPIIPGATTVVTNPNIGVTMTIAPDAAKNQDGSNYLGEISISEVPDGLAPAALPAELNPSLLITIQPVGVVFDPPAQIIFPNTDNLADGNEVNIWSLEAGTGTFIPVGQGVVSGSQILPIAGQEEVIRAVDWHLTLGFGGTPPTGGDPGKKKPDSCSVTGGSQVTVCHGELIEEHQLVSYRSLEVDRAPKLIYRSLSAAPQPIITNDPTLSKISAVPDHVSVKLEVGGVQQGADVFTDTSGLSETLDETIHHVVQFDASAFPTGDHPYRLTLTNHFGASSAGRFTTGSVLLQNEQSSPFGAGWTLDGLGHLTIQADGKAVITEGNGGAVVFDRPLPGTFGAPQSVAIEQDSTLPVQIGDYNEDGNLDLAIPYGFANAGRMQIRFGTGTGTFSGSLLHTTNFGNKFTAISQADFDQDGHLDLITTSAVFDDRVRINYGDGTGNFPVSASLQILGGTGNPQGVTTGDFDNNGFPDLATANLAAQNVVVRLNNGSQGLAGWGSELPTANIGFPGPDDVEAADFNGDGNLDLVVARNTRITLLYGDGTGHFPTSQDFLGISLALDLTVADFNQDGYPDVAATGSAGTPGDTVYYFQNNGIGGFLPLQTFTLQTNSSPDTVEAADLNNDGFLDLVTANSGSGGTVSIFFGDGLGNFDEPIDVPLLSSGRAVTVGDLDKTGTLGLVTRTVSLITEQVKILLNADPNGGFLSPNGDFTTFTENSAGTFTHRLKDGTQIHFDALGRQTSVVDRNGNTTTYAYDGTSDRVLTITDPVGLITALAYGPDDKLDSITDPANRITIFDHDADGNLTSITDPDNTTRTFAYDSGHHLTSQISKRGFETRYDYNFAGRVMKATRPDTSTNFFTPAKLVGLADTANGEGTQLNPLPVVRPSEVQATVTDARGKITTYQLDPFGNATLILDPLNRTTTTTRNTDGDATTIIAPNGMITDITYDTQGNVLTRKEAVGTSLERQTTFTYEPNFSQVTSITDLAGKVTTIQLDANGNPEKIINPLLDERLRTFDSRGLVLTDTDENGNTTMFTYDAQGNVATITDAEGHVTQFTRDAAGKVLTITEGVGTPEVRTRTLTYDALNRLTSGTDGTTNPPTVFRYDEQGNLEETEMPTGELEQRTYDPRERVATIDDPIRGLTQFSYDGNGNLLSSLNALNDPTTFEYDDANQLTKITDALTGEQTFTYDVGGNVKTFTDARTKTTTFDYDLLNRPIKRTNPLNQVTMFTYDTRSNLETTIDPKNQLISRTYDALSRLTQITTPDNTITVGYDAVGNPLTVEDADSKVTLTYDGLNRAITEGTTDLGVQPAVTLTSTYNAVGNRTQLVDTAPGTTVYEFDLAGRLTKLTTPASLDILLAYDPAGRLDTIGYPNGIVSDYSYDAQGRLNTLTHTLGANPSFSDFGYTYNPVGNILSIIDQVNSTQTRTYTYDALQRLKTGGTTGIPENYDYDLTGNRTTSFLSTAHIPDDANRLLEDDQFTYTYDANGNLETKTDKAVPTDITTYTWAAQDQLIQIDFPDSTMTSYKYDGLGRRIEKNVNGSITRYVFDGEDIALEYDGTNTFVARYSHGQFIDQPLAVQRAGVGFFYYHADHQGSIINLTDSSGLVANSYLYDSYGRTLTLSETISQPFTYTGREFDSESGLYYYRARYYDPDTGRFTQPDPVGFAGGLNLYAYAGGDPVNFVDPMGTTPAPQVTRILGSQANNYFTPTPVASNNNLSFDSSSNNTSGFKTFTKVVEGVAPILEVFPHTKAGAKLVKLATKLDKIADIARGAGQAIKSGYNSFKKALGFGTKNEDIPSQVFRGGGTNPSSLTPRPQDNGMLSTRDSLSNPYPLPAGQKPPLPAGKPIRVIDTSKLPPGSVV